MAYVKNVLKYLKGVKENRLIMRKSSSFDLIGYADASDGTDAEDFKSRSGWAVMLGGNLLFWRSIVQELQAHSTHESEYMAIDDCVRDMMKVINVVTELRLDNLLDKPILYSDNSSAVKLTSPERTKDPSRSILKRFHYIKELVNNGVLTVKQIKSEDQPADILTKVLPSPALRRHLAKFGIGPSLASLQTN